MTVWFCDPSFHTEDNWGTHLQLFQKIQTLTDALKEKPCIKSWGVKTFEQNEDVYIFLVLPKYHIFLFSTALQKLQKIVTCFSLDKLS